MFRDVALRALRAILDDNPVVYRAVLSRGNGGAFVQPSTVEALPSPAECVAVVACAGEEPVVVDLVDRLPSGGSATNVSSALA